MKRKEGKEEEEEEEEDEEKEEMEEDQKDNKEKIKFWQTFFKLRITILFHGFINNI